MITVRELSITYGQQNILSGVTFSLQKGQAAALVGDNGSGKSTLLSVLAGIVSPDSGEVAVQGSVAYLPQEVALIEELTFADNLKFFAALSGVKVPAVLPFGADELRKKRISKMSGGMKKLCSIVCTLLADADIYLFDEPCAALDAAHREMFLDHMRALLATGKTVIYVAHDRAEYAPFADAVITLADGKADVREVCHA